MKLIQIQTVILISILTVKAKLNITFHVESLNSNSTLAITDSFGPAIDKGLLEMADVYFNVAGNTNETVSNELEISYEFSCENGDEECYGNKIQNCVYKYAKDHVTALKTIVCIFENTNSDASNLGMAYRNCTIENGVSDMDVAWCAALDEGNQLLHEAVQATPRPTIFPWADVEYNRLSDYDRRMINSDVFQWVCDNYRGVKSSNCDQESTFQTVFKFFIWILEMLAEAN